MANRRGDNDDEDDDHDNRNNNPHYRNQPQPHHPHTDNRPTHTGVAQQQQPANPFLINTGENNNSTQTETFPIVRPEEILIVGLVLLLWIAAIVLFIRRWGKIRMLEPYQPKFQQQHRVSCPIGDIETTLPHAKRGSMSRLSMGMSFQMCGPQPVKDHIAMSCHRSRPRQNSVFVGTQVIASNPPRKTRSAVDIHSLNLKEECV